MHRQKNVKKIAGIVAGYYFCTVYTINAHAEWTVAAMAGLAEYTTTVTSNSLFQYPGNSHTNDLSAGISARYLWNIFHPRFAFGAESGYLWIAQNITRYSRNDWSIPAATQGTFTSESNGVILANLVARWAVVPTLGFSLFGGPAWLNTHYTATTLSPYQVTSSNAAYQITADLGLETNWLFKRHWSLGWRWETIFNTSRQSLSTNIKSQAAVSILSANLRYTFGP